MRADRKLTLGTFFVADGAQFFKVSNKVKREFKEIQAASVATEKSLNKFNRQISKVGGAVRQLISAAKVTAAYGVAATAIFSVVNAMRAGVDEIIAFDQALKNLQAITRATNGRTPG